MPVQGQVSEIGTSGLYQVTPAANYTYSKVAVSPISVTLLQGWDDEKKVIVIDGPVFKGPIYNPEPSKSIKFDDLNRFQDDLQHIDTRFQGNPNSIMGLRPVPPEVKQELDQWKMNLEKARQQQEAKETGRRDEASCRT